MRYDRGWRKKRENGLSLAKRLPRPLMMCARWTKIRIETKISLGNFWLIAVSLPVFSRLKGN
jgi:hypothetical protein